MISCTDCAGECAMSSAVMTVVDAPTMPANRRLAVTLLVCASLGGEPLGLPVCERFGATRRAPAPSSLPGLARVRFSSAGGLTSIGGSCSGAACCALAAEIPKERTGTRKVEASRKMRRRFAALMQEDMVRPRYDVSGTSQRTKSHQVPCAPWVKLMSVLPDRHSQWPMTKDSPLTVAGAAAALGKFPRTAFPFDPQIREPSRLSRSLPG